MADPKEISADEMFGASETQPTPSATTATTGQQGGAISTTTVGPDIGGAAPIPKVGEEINADEAFGTIDQGIAGPVGEAGAEAVSSLAQAGEDIIEDLGRPLNALNAAVQELIDAGPFDMADRLKRSINAAKDQFGDNPPPTMGMSDFIAQDLINRGLDSDLAIQSGNVTGTVLELGLDPLNAVTLPIGAAKGTAKGALGFAQAARSTPSPNVLEEIAQLSVKPSMSDRILGLTSGVDAPSIAILRSAPERVASAKPRVDLGNEIFDVVDKIKKEKSKWAAAVKETKATLAGLTKDKKNDLTNHTLPVEVADQFLESMGQMRARVSVASGEAFDVLASSGVGVNFSKPLSVIDSAIASAKVGGVPPPPGSQTSQSIGKLEQIGNFLRSVGKKGDLPAVQAKQVVQIIDDEVGVLYDALRRGDSITRPDRALLDVRSSIDEVLKGIPRYASVMKPLAQDVEMLKRARGMIRKDDPASLFSNPKGKEVLAHFDEAFQTNFTKEAEDVSFAARAKKDFTIFDTIPEISAAQERLLSAESELAKADAALTNLGPWARGTNPETVLNSISKNKKRDFERGAEAISRVLSGETGIQRNILDDLADTQALEGLQKVLPKFEKGKAPSLPFGALAGGLGSGVLFNKRILAGDPTIMAAIATTITVGGIRYARAVYGPVAAKRIVETLGAKSLAKATFSGSKGSKAAGFGKLFFDGNKAINLAPGIVNSFLQENSDLKLLGSMIIDDPEELNELRALTLAADMPNKERAKLLSMINGQIIEISLGDSPKEASQVAKELKLDFTPEALNKILKRTSGGGGRRAAE